MMTKSLKFTTTAALFGALLFADSRAVAGSANTTFTVTATVANNCTISAANLAFGAYDPIVANATTNLDNTGSVTITCTKGATTTIGLSAGSNGANATGTTRAMSTGGGSPSYLSYELFSDSGRTTVWGNSGGALFTPAAAPSKAARAFTVYGRIPSGQDVPASIAYSDTITATVNF